LQRSRARIIFREKRAGCLNPAKRDEFLSAPKNYLSKGSHACGVAKLPGAILLVLFF